MSVFSRRETVEEARAVPRSPVTLDASDLGALMDANADFVWRSLRRLGVPASSVDDATQQVFLIAQKKITTIHAGRERGFLFGVAVNVAAHARRTAIRRREVLGEDPSAFADPAPLPDATLDRARARALLDDVLDAMELDLRTVLVLSELEELTMAEIAEMLSLPPGTVASRLRRAREEFHKLAQRARARVERTTLRPPPRSQPEEAPMLGLRSGEGRR